MTIPTIGITFEKITSDIKAVIGSDMSVIGLIGTAPNASADKYPLNQPILIFSNDAAMTSQLGNSGTLLDAVSGINDQLAPAQLAAKIVIVRVAEGADIDATITNIVGSGATKTGVWAFAQAGALLGIVPRLIIAPGFTSQLKQGLGAAVIQSAGSGGTDGTFNLAFIGGIGSGAAGTFTVSSGSVTSVTITNPGVYSVAPQLSLTASSGLTGATVTIPQLIYANPVCVALPPVLNQLFGVAIVDGPATTVQAYSEWRETLGSDVLIPLERAVRVGSNAVVRPGSPRVAGIACRRDFENEGVPSKSWCNQPVHGIVGPNGPLSFSIADGANEGQQILAQNGGIIVRGETGVETAIAEGGYVYVGTDTTSSDPEWQFYHQVRMRQYIHLGFLKTLRSFLGRYNIDGHTLQAIYNTMDTWMRDLQAGQHILGYKINYPKDGNSAAQLMSGRVQILFKAEEPPVLRHIHIKSGRYLPALDMMIAGVQSQLDQFI